MATATRRELLAGMGSLVSIDFEPDNGGIVLSMDENSIRVSAAYPLVNQSKLRFTLRISPEKKVSGTGIVRCVSSTGRSADLDILEIDAESRTEFDLWMGGSTAEGAVPESPNSAVLPAPSPQPAPLSQTPILEIEQPALVLNSPPQETIPEPSAVALPAETIGEEVEIQQEAPIETPAAAVEAVASAASIEAPSPAPEPAIPFVAAPSVRPSAETSPKPPQTRQRGIAAADSIPPSPQQAKAIANFPLLLDGVTDAAASHVAAAVDAAEVANPAGALEIAPGERIADLDSDSAGAAVALDPVERKIPFAPPMPARPTAVPEPGEEDEFNISSLEPAEEPVAIEEPRIAGALYLPNYSVEGITACGTDWQWKEHLYSLPLLAVQVAGERFEEFGWSLERDWHIWLALALIGAGFLPLVTKPTFIPATLVLWLIGGRVAIRRRPPERAGEGS
jgi:hypothetical protein